MNKKEVWLFFKKYIFIFIIIILRISIISLIQNITKPYLNKNFIKFKEFYKYFKISIKKIQKLIFFIEIFKIFINFIKFIKLFIKGGFVLFFNLIL